MTRCYTTQTESHISHIYRITIHTDSNMMRTLTLMLSKLDLLVTSYNNSRAAKEKIGKLSRFSTHDGEFITYLLGHQNQYNQ